MRAFITGASGFVGGWLSDHLGDEGDEIFTMPADIDLAEPGAAHSFIEGAAPEVIYHLAALTHVGRSWDAPMETFRVNVLGTIELLEIVRTLVHVPRVVLISSAEVYGAGEGVVLTEEAPFRPVTPYAASKVAAEIAGLQAFLGRKVEVIRARPFNHVGPGQAEFFVVSALAKRIVEAEISGEMSISVGNLAAKRDFSDVRDVVRAYRLLASDGVPGEVYNICSGEARPIAELFTTLVELATSPVTPKIDEQLFRPVDVPLLVGSSHKLHALTGWEPKIAMSTTLSDVLEYWRSRLQPATTS